MEGEKGGDSQFVKFLNVLVNNRVRSKQRKRDRDKQRKGVGVGGDGGIMTSDNSK